MGPLAGEKENYYSKIHLTTVQLTTEKPAAVTVGCMVAGRQAALAAAAGAVKWLSREGERASERVCLFLVSRAPSLGGASERALSRCCNKAGFRLLLFSKAFLERVAARSGVFCGAFLGLAKESIHGGVCGRRGGGGGRGAGGDSEAAYRQA